MKAVLYNERLMTTCSNLALTGVSGVGKSTLLFELSKRLPKDVVARGFVSRSIIEKGTRVGWRLDTFTGHGGVLIHREIDTPHRFGEYGVDMGLLERLVELELANPGAADVCIIDEIGPVGEVSERFVDTVTDLLGSEMITVSAVHRTAPGFPLAVRERRDVELWHVTYENRATMPDEILRWGGWTTDGEPLVDDAPSQRVEWHSLADPD